MILRRGRRERGGLKARFGAGTVMVRLMMMMIHPEDLRD